MPETTTELLKLYGKMVDNQADQITVTGELNTNIKILNETLRNGAFKILSDQQDRIEKKTGKTLWAVIVLLVPMAYIIIRGILNG